LERAIQVRNDGRTAQDDLKILPYFETGEHPRPIWEARER